MESKVLLIYPNKKRVKLFFFSGFVLLAVGFGFWWIGIYFWTFLFVLIGIFNLLINFKKAFLNDFLLKLDEEGITDNMTFPSFGKIYWKEIKNAEIKNLSGFENIFIYLKDPEAYINQKNFLLRHFMRSNQENIGTTILLRCNVFPEQADKVVELINRLAKGKDVE